jgi:hypothetical protein
VQSGGNAVPLGKRKPAPVEDASADNSDFSSGSDSDEPLPGELDSDNGDDAEFDTGSDSQLQLPTDGFSDSDSDQPSAGQASDSYEDARLAAEQQGTASRQKVIPPASKPKAKSQQQQLPADVRAEVDASGDDFDDDDDDQEEDQIDDEAAAHNANRRNSHQVGAQ